MKLNRRQDTHNGSLVLLLNYCSFPFLNTKMLFIYTVDFYDFGASAGDAQLQRRLDGSSSPILLSVPFQFFGTPESILYVSQLCATQEDTTLQVPSNCMQPLGLSSFHEMAVPSAVGQFCVTSQASPWGGDSGLQHL